MSSEDQTRSLEDNSHLHHHLNSNNVIYHQNSSSLSMETSSLLKLDLTINELLSQKESILKLDPEWIKQFSDNLESKLMMHNEFPMKIGAHFEDKKNIIDDKQLNDGMTINDLNQCFEIVNDIADGVGARLILLCRKQIDSSIYYIDECLVRKKSQADDFQEVRIAVVGNVDSGKSTLLGVLTHCELDNGRGLARQRLFRHKHELETGRTSSIGNDILGFDSSGNIVNKPSAHGNSQQWSKICEESSKVITFIDLAGHEKYLKTTIFGMTGHSPDYTLLMIGANAGIVGMTKEHLGVTLALNIPVFVVITKIDMCPSNVLQNTIGSLKKILKSPGCRKIPILVESDEDVVISATNFVSERLCPIFQVSNVEGTNLDYLKKFLNLLNSRAPNYDNCPAEFQIDEVYSVPGVGTVVSGLSMKGVIKVNDTLLLGPDFLGNFVSVAIKSIHRKRLPVKEVHSGQTASFALKKIRKNEIRKGMMMLCPSLNPKSYWEFEGEILVLHHPTTISPRYQAMVHCGSIRQTAQILTMSQDCLRTGDKAKVHFRFIKNPEYLNVGMKLIFREGRTKAIGTVIRLLPGSAPRTYCPMKRIYKNNPMKNRQATLNNR